MVCTIYCVHTILRYIDRLIKTGSPGAYTSLPPTADHTYKENVYGLIDDLCQISVSRKTCIFSDAKLEK